MKIKRAFTILELLCVIAIIVLLICLLMPSLSRVRRQATRVICVSYLSGYGKAGQSYLTDNDEVFPDPNEWLYAMKSANKDHPIGCRWHDWAMSQDGEIMQTFSEYRGKMWAYFDESGISPCPIFRDCKRAGQCENPEHNQQIDVRPQYSYTMNGYLGTMREGGALRVSELRDPSKVFFFAEENSWSLRPDHPTYPAKWLSIPLSTKALDDTALFIDLAPRAINCFATYHEARGGDLNRGKGNVVFVDGHTESIDADDQIGKGSHRGRGRLGPAGNLSWAWASKTPLPGGLDKQ